MEFQARDKVMLKVLPWKGVVHFDKRGKLNPRYVGPFKVLERVEEVDYKLELPEEQSGVHITFYVSNLKKCHADEPLAVPLDGLHFDDKLHFVEEPVEIVDREVKRLKKSRIPLVKVASDDLRDALSVIYLTYAHSRIEAYQKKFTRVEKGPIEAPTLSSLKAYLKGRPKLGLWYPKDSPFILEAFSDSDYAGASLDRKSTTGGCQFLGSRLISWQCKKQTVVANLTPEAEYITASH
ncbi:hypothetical protein Tco_0659729 [Tanacetum coccineum]